MTTQHTYPARVDTHDMVVVHRVFRREFRLLPRLVRTVSAGDTARATRVNQHAKEILTALHYHHTGEDELLWPRLAERAPLSQELVTRMETQHQRLADLLGAVQVSLARWSKSANGIEQRRLAGILDQVSKALEEHLAEEEREILPLVEQHFTVAEWEQLGERGMASIPKRRLLVILGYILEETSPDERRHFLAKVPLPGRVAYRLVGARQYRREVGELRGVLATA
jgi:hemerythrin-like domain-containing protein